MEKLLQYSQNKHVLLVAHAGVMRRILSHVLDMPIGAMYRINTPNASTSRVKVTGFGTKNYPPVIGHCYFKTLINT